MSLLLQFSPTNAATYTVFISKRRYLCSFHHQAALLMQFSSSRAATYATFIIKRRYLCGLCSFPEIGDRGIEESRTEFLARHLYSVLVFRNRGIEPTLIIHLGFRNRGIEESRIEFHDTCTRFWFSGIEESRNRADTYNSFRF